MRIFVGAALALATLALMRSNTAAYKNPKPFTNTPPPQPEQKPGPHRIIIMTK